MYNEVTNARTCIDAVMKSLKQLSQKVTLLVVNDGSKDATLNVLHKAKKKYGTKLLVITYPKNKGYGGAIATGIKEALKRRFTFGLVMDSDLTNNPKDIARLLQIQKNTNADCVKASRYIKGGNAKEVLFYRWIISRLGNFFASLLFGIGIHDCTNGFCLFRLEIFKNVTLKENGFAIIVEMLYWIKKWGATCIEMPIKLTTRKDGSSSFTYRPKVFYHYILWAFKAATL